MDEIKTFAYKTLASMLAEVDKKTPAARLREYCRKAAGVIEVLLQEQEELELAQLSGFCPYDDCCPALNQVRRVAVDMGAYIMRVEEDRPKQEVIIFENMRKPRRRKDNDG